MVNFKMFIIFVLVLVAMTFITSANAAPNSGNTAGFNFEIRLFPFFDRPFYGPYYRPVYQPTYRPFRVQRQRVRHHRYKARPRHRVRQHRPRHRPNRRHRRGELSGNSGELPEMMGHTGGGGIHHHRMRPRPVYLPVPGPAPPAQIVPVQIPAQRPTPFVVPDYGPPDMVQCRFVNSSNRDARVMVKVTYHLERTRWRLMTPVTRVARQYITIKANTRQLVSFRIAQSNRGGSHEVVVLKGDVKYNCGFGRQ